MSDAASGEVKVFIRPLMAEQLNSATFADLSDSDTSSESDVAEITGINEMREIISRMDDDDEGGERDRCGRSSFGMNTYACSQNLLDWI